MNCTVRKWTSLFTLLAAAPAAHAAPSVLTLAEHAALKGCPSGDQECRKLESWIEPLALLVSSKGGQCTSFLVAEDIVMTNSHCVPEELRRVGSDCSEEIAFKFVGTSSVPEEIVGCDHVLSATQIKVKDGGKGKKEVEQWNPDYAFIRLASPVARRPLPLAWSGPSTPELKIELGTQSGGAVVSVEPRDRVLVTMIDPARDRLGGSVRVQNCRASSIWYSSSQILTNGCGIVFGNSGSPVLNEEGQILGIVDSTDNAKVLEDMVTQKLRAQKRELLTTDELQEIRRLVSLMTRGQGTNIACVEFPAEVRDVSVPASCRLKEGYVRDAEGDSVRYSIPRMGIAPIIR